MRFAFVMLLGCLWLVTCGCGGDAVEKSDNTGPPPAEKPDAQAAQQMTLD